MGGFGRLSPEDGAAKAFGGSLRIQDEEQENLFE